MDSLTRKGKWPKHKLGLSCRSLYGKKVGLVGVGKIGIEVARMLQGFGVSISYYKRNRLSFETENQYNLTYKPFREVLMSCDILSIHCPLTDETRNLISKEEFEVIKPGCILINTSRGGIVNEKYLIQALQTGVLSFAGLDVFDVEPLGLDSSFSLVNNAILTPHSASITKETFRMMIESALLNISAFDSGKIELIKSSRIV
jgi:lactate dehydrogenase-like 2-hydroxyacid dehydrogenase